ncbi:MAG: type II CRISPR RNA-guided endonuclease Cas9, partial [Proteobacteria bacterium]|nr:type II CRISPR RNA-guided endonuclease Cas9 [Pseudomonadota bacterium]
TYTLGLDIGMASVGAALLTNDSILALHVRTFDKAETAKEGEPLNLIRREARLTRRRIRRRSFRLLRLTRLFKRVGMIPQANPKAFAIAQQTSTWQLRSEGLDRLLTPSEWAAVLYHIVKHRGFLSNRKSEAKADEKTEAGQMLSGVSANQARMKAGNYRTIGEMVAKDEAFITAKRNKGGDYSHTFSRLDLAHELTALFAAQRQLGSQYANADIEQQLQTSLMAKKPIGSVIDKVGKCTFETAEYRAPKASHSAERFVWLTKLNNLRITTQGETRGLFDYERAALINLPFTQGKLTYKQVRSKLNLNDSEKFIGLAYRHDKDIENSSTLFEAKAFHTLRKAYENAELASQWQRDSIDSNRLDTLAYAQTVFKDDTEASNYLMAQGVENEIIEAVLSVSFSEFIRLSLKALAKILPYMTQGQRYDEAVQSAGYAHHSQLHIGEQKSQYIPHISKDDIPNPVVYRSLNQARKLVNAIVKRYGAPSSVHIELARDLNKPFDERRKIEKDQKTFQETKQKDIQAFEDTFGRTPRGTDLIKWRLYREQNAQSAYSQKPFDLILLFSDGYAEIDHALPYSRSFDDGMNNKVLVLTAENRNKGNRTPYEYLDGASDSPQWRAFVAFVESNPKYRQAKKTRLLRKNFDGDESAKFRERNLTDTRYASKKFKELVETHLQLHSESKAQRCVVVSGQLTSLLRARWGLLKVRENGDLHHALDAAVVAATSHSMVKRMSDYAKHKELAFVQSGFVDPETGEIPDIHAHDVIKEHFPEPWPKFRDELLARLNPNPATFFPEGDAPQTVRVSRAPLRKGLGQAHQETIRSAKRLDEQLSTIKTPLTSLKLKELPNIVGYADPRNADLIAAIEQRLRAFNDDGAKAFKEPLYRPSKDMSNAPLVRSVNLLTTQKSGISVRGGIAANGSMLRVDIFSKAGKFYAVPLYVADAVKSNLPMIALPKNELMDDTYQFLFSLNQNDWIKVTQKGKPIKEGYFSGFNRATGNIDIWAHDRNPAIGNKGLIESIGIKLAVSVEKHHVDMLGNLYPVRHELRQPLRLPKAGKQG